MDWKKIADAKDLIVFEKEQNNTKIKIEARKTDESWEVFKTQIVGNESNLISEYSLTDKNQVVKLIEKLKNEKNSKVRIPRYEKLSVKRAYKEEFIEKWFFHVGNDKEKNFLFAKFDNDIMVDVVMHEKFKPHEKKIIDEVEGYLGLKDLGESINYDIYYFNRKNSSKTQQDTQEYNMNFIDIEFDPDEDYYSSQ